MELPEGLLELEAPLSAEEKQRQKSEADEARCGGRAAQAKEVRVRSPRAQSANSGGLQ